MDLFETTINSKDIFEGKIIKVRVDKVALPDGRESTREIVEHADAVAIVAVDDQHRIWMVRQYRKPVEQVLLEIPAGIMEKGEAPLFSAQRELKEETGFTAGNWEKILEYYSAPGFSNEKLHVFLATDLKSGATCPDQDEFLQVAAIPLKEAYDLIFKGQIIDGKSIIGIQYACGRLK